MKRHGPPLGSGPGSDADFRVAGERSDTRSDTWRASLPTHSLSGLSRPPPPEALLAGTALLIVLRVRGRSRFDALLNGVQIVKASKNPISDAARFLHRQGYSDDRLLLARHAGAKHDAMHGPLGKWRKVRVREDRGLRYVAWEARPRRVGAKKGRRKVKGAEHRAQKKNASTTTPGAVKWRSSGSAPSAEEPAIDPKEAPMARLSLAYSARTVRVDGGSPPRCSGSGQF
jgi:hypothetical protein